MLRSYLFRAILSVFAGLLSLPEGYAGNKAVRERDGAVISDSSGRIIGQITITGNRQTRPSIILRELTFTSGDTVAAGHLQALLLASRENVFNTRLFNLVTLDTLQVPGSAQTDIQINVIERWYVWPIPYFQVSDRNFNAWWETRDLSRLTYGIDLTFYNVRGRNETLKLITHFGFNQMYGFTYRTPYINRRQTLGIGFGADVSLNHEVPVITVNDKPVYIRNDEKFMRQMIHGYFDLFLRPDLYTMHTFHLAFNSCYFADTVIKTPGFITDGSNFQRYFTVNYFFKDDHRDMQFYPLTGYYIDAEFNLSLPYDIARNLYLKANFRKYWQLYRRWYWASGITAKVSFARDQPYYLEQGLGYGREYVRGYELYVADGQHFILFKNNLKFALLPQRIINLRFIRSSRFNTVPLAFYLNLFTDLGYVVNYGYDGSEESRESNTLPNSLMVGYGAGLDFTTYYDIVIRLEFALNLLGKPGLYVNFVAPI